MTDATEKTTVTELSLVKLGRSGTRTHIADVTYEVVNPGTPRQRMRPVSAYAICGTSDATCGGHGRLAIHVIGPAKDVEPTCKLCQTRRMGR